MGKPKCKDCIKYRQRLIDQSNMLRKLENKIEQLEREVSKDGK